MATPLSWSTTLLDDHTTPPLRAVLGTLLGRATHADVAIAHVRLVNVDLRALDVRRVHCRILLGRLDVDELTGMAADDAGNTASTTAASPALSPAGAARAGAAARLAAIARFLDSGRLDIRAGGLLRWKPDFSVFQLGAPGDAVALVGAHYFTDPDVVGGPALTCVLRTPASVQRVRRRFEELWLRARDVRDVVRAELRILGA